uniref:Uncharacterized protein n=1 Tax=Syphacia muris TaxID=451379 RepID=A0A0N5B0F6_9BILA
MNEPNSLRGSCHQRSDFRNPSNPSPRVATFAGFSFVSTLLNLRLALIVQVHLPDPFLFDRFFVPSIPKSWAILQVIRQTLASPDWGYPSVFRIRHLSEWSSHSFNSFDGLAIDF